VQKQVLGKSIGRLLDSTKSVVEPANRADGKLDPDKISSPGLKVLVGSGGSSSLNPDNGVYVDNKIKPEIKKKSLQSSHSKIPLWFLIVADVVLVGMAYMLTIEKSRNITKLEIGISVAGIIVGGILTCWGIVILKNKE